MFDQYFENEYVILNKLLGGFPHLQKMGWAPETRQRFVEECLTDG